MCTYAGEAARRYLLLLDNLDSKGLIGTTQVYQYRLGAEGLGLKIPKGRWFALVEKDSGAGAIVYD